jgi:hypothetical protein
VYNERSRKDLMFKNKAMYVEMVPKKEISGIPYDPEPVAAPIAETINEIIGEQGKNVVKGAICVIGAYFGFKTVSAIIVNSTDPRK